MKPRFISFFQLHGHDSILSTKASYIMHQSCCGPSSSSMHTSRHLLPATCSASSRHFLHSYNYSPAYYHTDYRQRESPGCRGDFPPATFLSLSNERIRCVSSRQRSFALHVLPSSSSSSPIVAYLCLEAISTSW